MTRIIFVCQCLTGLQIIEQSSFMNIKYVFRLVYIDYCGQFFTFPVHHSFGIYNGTFSQHSLVYQVVFFYNGLSSCFKPEKPTVPIRTATCRAFSFRLGPSIDVLEVCTCLSHTKRWFQVLPIAKSSEIWVL